MSEEASTSRWRKWLIGIVAAALSWLVISHSVAAFVAGTAPQAAVWLNSRQPEALITLAERAMRAASSRASAGNSTTTPGTGGRNFDDSFSAFETTGTNGGVNRPSPPAYSAEIGGWALAALRGEPLNATALRILGQLAEASNDDTKAENLMRTAASVSLHDGTVLLWLLEKSVEAKDDQAALEYADALMRTRPEMVSLAVPLLAHLAEDRDFAGLIEPMLAANPPWRGEFLAALPQHGVDVRLPLQLLVALRNSPAPPVRTEIDRYVGFLVEHHFYDLAYYTWLQFLPADQLHEVGLLFNGTFKHTPSGDPFDWRISQGSGVTVDIVPKPDQENARALLVDFQFGRVEYQSVSELVMLSPGRYEFKGQYKGKLDGPRGMKWRVYCAPEASAPLGESEMINGLAPIWQTATFSFTVPATGCPAQTVRLDLDSRMASEQLISGSMLFDDLQISRSQSPPS